MDTLIKKEFLEIVTADRFRDKLEDLISYSYDAFTVESLPELVLTVVLPAWVVATVNR